MSSRSDDNQAAANAAGPSVADQSSSEEASSSSPTTMDAASSASPTTPVTPGLSANAAAMAAAAAATDGPFHFHASPGVGIGMGIGIPGATDATAAAAWLSSPGSSAPHSPPRGRAVSLSSTGAATLPLAVVVPVVVVTPAPPSSAGPPFGEATTAHSLAVQTPTAHTAAYLANMPPLLAWASPGLVAAASTRAMAGGRFADAQLDPSAPGGSDLQPFLEQALHNVGGVQDGGEDSDGDEVMLAADAHHVLDDDFLFEQMRGDTANAAQTASPSPSSPEPGPSTATAPEPTIGRAATPVNEAPSGGPANYVAGILGADATATAESSIPTTTVPVPTAAGPTLLGDIGALARNLLEACSDAASSVDDDVDIPDAPPPPPPASAPHEHSSAGSLPTTATTRAPSVWSALARPRAATTPPDAGIRAGGSRTRRTTVTMTPAATSIGLAFTSTNEVGRAQIAVKFFTTLEAAGRAAGKAVAADTPMVDPPSPPAKKQPMRCDKHARYGSKWLQRMKLGGYEGHTTTSDGDQWYTEEAECDSDDETVTDLHESVFGRADKEAGNDSGSSGGGAAQASDSGSGRQAGGGAGSAASYADMSSGDTLESGDHHDAEGGATRGQSLRSSMEDKILHFAYGSNMSLEWIQRRCPSAEPVGLARLAGWRWMVNGNGVANVLPINPEESFLVGSSDEDANSRGLPVPRDPDAEDAAGDIDQDESPPSSPESLLSDEGSDHDDGGGAVNADEGDNNNNNDDAQPEAEAAATRDWEWGLREPPPDGVDPGVLGIVYVLKSSECDSLDVWEGHEPFNKFRLRVRMLEAAAPDEPPPPPSSGQWRRSPSVAAAASAPPPPPPSVSESSESSVASTGSDLAALYPTTPLLLLEHPRQEVARLGEAATPNARAAAARDPPMSSQRRDHAQSWAAHVADEADLAAARAAKERAESQERDAAVRAAAEAAAAAAGEASGEQSVPAPEVVEEQGDADACAGPPDAPAGSSDSDKENAAPALHPVDTNPTTVEASTPTTPEGDAKPTAEPAAPSHTPAAADDIAAADIAIPSIEVSVADPASPVDVDMDAHSDADAHKDTHADAHADADDAADADDEADDASMPSLSSGNSHPSLPAPSSGSGRNTQSSGAEYFTWALVYVDQTNVADGRPSADFTRRMRDGVKHAIRDWNMPNWYLKTVVDPF